jgi:hypothetical protein
MSRKRKIETLASFGLLTGHDVRKLQAKLAEPQSAMPYLWPRARLGVATILAAQSVALLLQSAWIARLTIH